MYLLILTRKKSQIEKMPDEEKFVCTECGLDMTWNQVYYIDDSCELCEYCYDKIMSQIPVPEEEDEDDWPCSGPPNCTRECLAQGKCW